MPSAKGKCQLPTRFPTGASSLEIETVYVRSQSAQQTCWALLVVAAFFTHSFPNPHFHCRMPITMPFLRLFTIFLLINSSLLLIAAKSPEEEFKDDYMVFCEWKSMFAEHPKHWHGWQKELLVDTGLVDSGHSAGHRRIGSAGLTAKGAKQIGLRAGTRFNDMVSMMENIVGIFTGHWMCGTVHGVGEGGGGNTSEAEQLLRQHCAHWEEAAKWVFAYAYTLAIHQGKLPSATVRPVRANGFFVQHFGIKPLYQWHHSNGNNEDVPQQHDEAKTLISFSGLLAKIPEVYVQLHLHAKVPDVRPIHLTNAPLVEVVEQWRHLYMQMAQLGSSKSPGKSGRPKLGRKNWQNLVKKMTLKPTSEWSPNVHLYNGIRIVHGKKEEFLDVADNLVKMFEQKLSSRPDVLMGTAGRLEGAPPYELLSEEKYGEELECSKEFLEEWRKAAVHISAVLKQQQQEGAQQDEGDDIRTEHQTPTGEDKKKSKKAINKDGEKFGLLKEYAPTTTITEDSYGQLVGHISAQSCLIEKDLGKWVCDEMKKRFGQPEVEKWLAELGTETPWKPSIIEEDFFDPRPYFTMSNEEGYSADDVEYAETSADVAAAETHWLERITDFCIL